MLTDHSYNPDVLSCIANLSSDEVFTPPELVNQMLDLLPQELFRDKSSTFLDPACKSGVFLREIAKRLDIGLEAQIPNRQKRIDHIFTKQLFGLAITELTSLLSRRSLYCSKAANGKYSVCSQFKNESGNIRYTRIEHTWQNGRCIYCGASEQGYDRGEELESHAYSFIHTENPEDLFKMKFDVIIGNPPYQMNDGGGTGSSSKPIYQLFVTQAKKLSPRYLSMIIPSRWFAGGKGLDEFRDSMLNDNRISVLVDFPIASEVFPGVRINGGVCYFLWELNRAGDCSVTTAMNNSADTLVRSLNEFDTFIRFNKAITIVKKIRSKSLEFMDKRVLARNPFGIISSYHPAGYGEVDLYALKQVGKVEGSSVSVNHELINKWKVLISKGYGEGGESREYPRMIIGKPIVAKPPSACTETYLVVDVCADEAEAKNLASYISTRFFRFLVGLMKNTQNVSRKVFAFVPIQDFNEPWTDEKLYKKYNLNQEEIDFIESMIRPMELADA